MRNNVKCDLRCFVADFLQHESRADQVTLMQGKRRTLTFRTWRRCRCGVSPKFWRCVAWTACDTAHRTATAASASLDDASTRSTCSTLSLSREDQMAVWSQPKVARLESYHHCGVVISVQTQRLTECHWPRHVFYIRGANGAVMQLAGLCLN